MLTRNRPTIDHEFTMPMIAGLEWKTWWAWRPVRVDFPNVRWTWFTTIMRSRIHYPGFSYYTVYATPFIVALAKDAAK